MIVWTLRRNGAHSLFEIHESFKRFVANIALVDQEWLRLGVALFCWRKESIQQLLLTTVSTSLVVMTTSRNWLKDTKETKVSNSWVLKLNSEWAKARNWQQREPYWNEPADLTDNRDVWTLMNSLLLNHSGLCHYWFVYSIAISTSLTSY